MSDDNSTSIDNDNLDDFSNDFFGNGQPEESPTEEKAEEPSQDDAEDTSDGEDTPATEETEDEVEDQVDDEPAPKPKKKSAQERINDITREKHEAIRRAEDLERRLAALESNKREEAPKEIKPTGAPTPDDKAEDGSDKYPLGEYDPAFVRDTARFEVRQELEIDRVRNEELRQARQREQEHNNITTAWNAKVKEAEVDLPAAQQALAPIFSNVDPDYREYLAATIMTLDAGPKVFQYLAEHLDEAEALINAGPTAATITLGKLEAKLTPENGTKPKPKVSQAPTPPPTNRGMNGRFEVADDTDDLEAFEDKFFVAKKRR